MVLENGMYKCGVCGKAFPLEIGGHYISRDNGKSGLFAAIQSNPEEQLFDTFDCPHCGCQNVAQSRKRRFIESAVDYEENTEIDSETEVETECDGDGPACEGTSPDCPVPCPGIADCPLCQEPEDVEEVPDCMGYYQKYIEKCYLCDYKKMCMDKSGVTEEQDG